MAIDPLARLKYPRTYHLPFSQGIHSDDKIIDSLARLDDQEVIASVKYDGENTTLKKECFHARSVDSPYNFTRYWIRQLHQTLRHDIPEGWRFCGENVSYYHSIEYTDLDSFFYLFSIWDDNNRCLSWDDMQEWAQTLELATPPVLYRGKFDIAKLQELANSLDTSVCEGFTVRLASSFHYDEFSECLTKWVRAGHVQPSANGKEEHWLKRTYPNRLKDPSKVLPSYMQNIYLNP